MSKEHFSTPSTKGHLVSPLLQQLDLLPQMKRDALKAEHWSRCHLSSPARSFPAELSSGPQAQDSPAPTARLQNGSRVAPR